MVLVAAFVLLALFSIVSIVMSAEERAHPTDYQSENPLLWATLGRR
jgi:hypothetical protein